MNPGSEGVDTFFSFPEDDTYSLNNSPEAIEHMSMYTEALHAPLSQPSSASSTSLALEPMAGDSAFASPVGLSRGLGLDGFNFDFDPFGLKSFKSFDSNASFETPQGALNLFGVLNEDLLKQPVFQAVAEPVSVGTIDPNALSQAVSPETIPFVNVFGSVTTNFSPTAALFPTPEVTPDVPLAALPLKRKGSDTSSVAPAKKRPGRPPKSRSASAISPSLSNVPSPSARQLPTVSQATGNKTEQARKLIPDKFLDRAESISGLPREELLKYKFNTDLLGDIDASKHVEMNRLFAEIQATRDKAKKAASDQRTLNKREAAAKDLEISFLKAFIKQQGLEKAYEDFATRL